MSLDTILYPLALIKFWSNSISKDIEKLEDINEVQYLDSSLPFKYIDDKNSVNLTKSKDNEKYTKNIKL